MPNRPIEPVSSESAIAAALSQNWKAAIRINSILVKQNKLDIDALNRLGYAHMMAAKLSSAKRMYQNVLDIDPYNQIALKNTKKLGNLKKKDMQTSITQAISPLEFLEEPGKTKIAVCINVAPSRVLSTLTSGQEVLLKARNHCVEIRTLHNNTYLGALPDDLSFKLLKLLTGGNRYKVIVKSIGKNIITVLLREKSRGKRFANQPSFISGSSFVGNLQSDQRSAEVGPDVTPTGEEEHEQNQDEDHSS